VIVAAGRDADLGDLGMLLGRARIPVLVVGDARIAAPGVSQRRLGSPPRRSALLDCAAELLAGRVPLDAAPAPSPRRAAPRVLVAEDNQVNQKVVEAMLKKLGCEVVIAADGVEAVAQCTGSAFDLVLMDYQMPGLDGPEAARRIRACEAELGHARVAIVALTANVGQDVQQICADAGMDDFVAKPMQRADLARVVDKYCP